MDLNTAEFLIHLAYKQDIYDRAVYSPSHAQKSCCLRPFFDKPKYKTKQLSFCL